MAQRWHGRNLIRPKMSAIRLCTQVSDDIKPDRMGRAIPSFLDWTPHYLYLVLKTVDLHML